MRSLPAKEARATFSSILDAAESGEGTLVIRNSRPVAAILPVEAARLLPLMEQAIAEIATSAALADDPAADAAVAAARAALENGEVLWYRI